MMAGDITKKLDPYFPFEKAIEQWGRSFAALGIAYEGASMSLDLFDVPTKKIKDKINALALQFDYNFRQNPLLKS